MYLLVFFQEKGVYFSRFKHLKVKPDKYLKRSKNIIFLKESKTRIIEFFYKVTRLLLYMKDVQYYEIKLTLVPIIRL